MSVFIVTSRRHRADLAAAISREFPLNHYKFTENVWLISTSDTVVELSHRLGVRQGGINGVMVAKMAPAYYGLASPELWDWIRAALEKSDDG